MVENIGAEVLRDTELERELLAAVVADRNDQPRSKQLQVGPSEVGGCRELLRAGLFEPDTTAEPETSWASAAHVGTVMGADLERIFGERLGALTQQRITATFGMLGVQISGSIDLLFMGKNQISDLKSSADIGGLLYDLKRDASVIETLLSIHAEGKLYQKNIETPDGGYELTEVVVSKLSKLHYYVQIAIYVMGAMQQGILDENAEGRLVFYDRSGGYQDFVAVRIPSDQIDLFYAIGQLRIGQVLQAQSAYEATAGNPAVLATLRDKAPSYCFSPKVQCSRREHCWTGSEWTADNQITNTEHIAAVNRYVIGRDLAKLADGMKRAARDELKQDSVTGMLPDGKMVTWAGNGAINVVETTVSEPKHQELLDRFIPPVDLGAEVERERAVTVAAEAALPRMPRDDRWKILEKTKAPEVRKLAISKGIEAKGLLKEDLIYAILDIEYPEEAGTFETPADSLTYDEPIDEVLRTVDEIRAAHTPEVVAADPNELLEGEDPERPGLFLFGMPSKDQLRQMQYDSDPAWRERLLAVRVKFTTQREVPE